ncbi:MAG: KOW domain-containing RNA-binding protein [Oscillospiraceae bacterium]|nr:KOW domain-containing RNA-binding protein [Oscillospiraceae bacterium]
MNIADIVVSINGRDAGKRFVVTGTENEYSLIANGKGRRLEKPKRKKNKHLRFEGKASSNISEKLLGGEKITNSELRRELASEGGVPTCQKMT